MCITVIFVIKIAFIVMTLIHIYLKVKNRENDAVDKRVVYWKNKFEFIFICLMSILLVYLFNPTKNRDRMLDEETKILLFLFGFVLLITAKWNTFFKEDLLVQTIQKILSV